MRASGTDSRCIRTRDVIRSQGSKQGVFDRKSVVVLRPTSNLQMLATRHSSLATDSVPSPSQKLQPPEVTQHLDLPANWRGCWRLPALGGDFIPHVRVPKLQDQDAAWPARRPIRYA